MAQFDQFADLLQVSPWSLSRKSALCQVLLAYDAGLVGLIAWNSWRVLGLRVHMCFVRLQHGLLSIQKGFAASDSAGYPATWPAGWLILFVVFCRSIGSFVIRSFLVEPMCCVMLQACRHFSKKIWSKKRALLYLTSI